MYSYSGLNIPSDRLKGCVLITTLQMRMALIQIKLSYCTSQRMHLCKDSALKHMSCCLSYWTHPYCYPHGKINCGGFIFAHGASILATNLSNKSSEPGCVLTASKTPRQTLAEFLLVRLCYPSLLFLMPHLARFMIEKPFAQLEQGRDIRPGPQRSLGPVFHFTLKPIKQDFHLQDLRICCA